MIDDTWGYIILGLGVGAFVAYTLFLYFSEKRGDEFDFPVHDESYKDDE